MTIYLDVAAASNLVRSMGLEPLMADLVRAIKDDYCRWADFDKAARTAHHFPKGVIELMPIADKNLYGFKYVNGHPKNTDKNLLTVMAFGVLAETATGMPLLLSELTLMTALRTAATSVLAAQHLARKNSKSMAIIGNGAQSEFQVIAFKALMGITEIRAFDIDKAATEKLIRNLDGMEGLSITAAKSIDEAVTGADIVTTVTADKTNATILTSDMIEPGMFINAVGGDCPGKTELHPDVLKMARVIVEYEPQTRIEGDIQSMPKDFPVTELWRILTGKEPGRQHDSQVTVFDSVGFALEDFSTLRCLYEIAKARNIGIPLDLIPGLSNPRDLYSLVGTAEIMAQQAKKLAAV